MRAGSTLAAVCMLTWPVVASAQLTPAQLIDRRAIADLTFSPDGTRLAFTVTDPPKGAERNRDIWVLDVGSRDARQFTSAPKSDNHPQWSPDGRSLAFLSNRDENTQIFVMPLDGGEPRRLTEGKRSIEDFEWSPDGKRIAFLAPEAETDAEAKQTVDRDDERVVDRDDKLTRLWVLDVVSQQVRQLTDGRLRVSEVAWLPSNDRLIVVATKTPESDQWTDRLYAIDAAGGTPVDVGAPRGPIEDLAVSPDGRTIAYLAARVDGPSPHDLYLQAIDGGAARNVTGAAIDRPIARYHFRANGSIVALAQTGFSSALFSIGLDGSAERLAAPQTTMSALAMASSERIAFVGQTATDAPEIYVGTSSGNAAKATHINDRQRLALVRPEMFRYKSFDGTDIEASLLVPRDRATGARVPLVVLVHGGPTGRWADSFDAWGQLLASGGYAVLSPNIRGSAGYGHRFLEMNRADWGGADFKDVMAGVDAVIARGVADPGRLGIGGWSYGGYMAQWAVTQTSRFKAAVAGAGMSDLAVEYGTEQGPAYDEWFYGLPYEKPEGFARSSPITYVKQVKTPTLMLHGERDPIDPLSQSQIFYRALKRYAVPSDLVIYPREPHGIGEERHVLDVLTRMSAWFDKYVKTGERTN